MVLRSILLAGGACAVVTGVAVAGSAAGARSVAPAVPAAVASVDDASLASAVVAADTDATAPADAGAARTLAGHRERLCARVPTAITRTQNLEKRLAADASTQGSLAYLQARIDKAEADHADQLVATLKNRLAFRTQLAAFLPDRLALLQKAQSTICAVPAPSSSSS